jgi:hypothetical protein
MRTEQSSITEVLKQTCQPSGPYSAKTPSKYRSKAQTFHHRKTNMIEKVEENSLGRKKIAQDGNRIWGLCQHGPNPAMSWSPKDQRRQAKRLLGIASILHRATERKTEQQARTVGENQPCITRWHDRLHRKLSGTYKNYQKYRISKVSGCKTIMQKSAFLYTSSEPSEIEMAKVLFIVATEIWDASRSVRQSECSLCLLTAAKHCWWGWK